MTEIAIGHADAAHGDRAVVRALRVGDREAFAALVDALSPQMIRLAMQYVPSRAVAEEVVQEAWLGVIKGLGRFEERSALKTWIFRILINTAKTRGARERRSVPFSALGGDGEGGEPSVDPDRFLPANDPVYPHHWASVPPSWDDLPEQRLLAAETRSVIEQALETLPPAQREVVTLRDISGFESEEVCELLGLSEGNQRVLLHRGRAKIRAVLERHLEA